MYFLSPVFTVSLLLLNLFHYSMEHLSVERRVLIVFAKIFLPDFRQKKLIFFSIFSEEIRQSSSRTALLNLDALFLQT